MRRCCNAKVASTLRTSFLDPRPEGAILRANFKAQAEQRDLVVRHDTVLNLGLGSPVH